MVSYYYYFVNYGITYYYDLQENAMNTYWVRVLYHSHSLNFGKFYEWDDCPPNSFANGFEVKADTKEKKFQ
ncbi:hypothetical protein Avbf_17205 [Armadillidium vulgare]|nr:hypothetical protein Avbf_17205 [Armadillidium vulgare]